MTTVRRCSKCGVEQPLSQFHRRAERHQLWCKACRRAWDSLYHATTRERRKTQRAERHQRLVARMRELKSRPCLDCEGNFHPAAMTFDHRPGTEKVGDLASLAGRGLTGLFEQELAKCDVVCANCHAVRTFRRREASRASRTSVSPNISEQESPYVVRAA